MDIDEALLQQEHLQLLLVRAVFLDPKREDQILQSINNNELLV